MKSRWYAIERKREGGGVRRDVPALRVDWWMKRKAEEMMMNGCGTRQTKKVCCVEASHR